MTRETCLRCEQNGTRTPLVQTVRGGICPIHEPEWIDRIRTNALATLGLPPRPTLLGKGVPKIGGTNR